MVLFSDHYCSLVKQSFRSTNAPCYLECPFLLIMGTNLHLIGHKYMIVFSKELKIHQTSMQTESSCSEAVKSDGVWWRPRCNQPAIVSKETDTFCFYAPAETKRRGSRVTVLSGRTYGAVSAAFHASNAHRVVGLKSSCLRPSLEVNSRRRSAYAKPQRVSDPPL